MDFIPPPAGRLSTSSVRYVDKCETIGMGYSDEYSLGKQEFRATGPNSDESVRVLCHPYRNALNGLVQ
uniref:Uncharacterized protein n=1 Tax=Panagrellus redivivus TaxID=6233 RepID=A0A7E4W3N0_PANRE